MTSRPPPIRRRGALGLIAAAAASPAFSTDAASPEAALRRICARAARDPQLAALGRAYRARFPGTSPGLADLASGLPAGGERAVVEALRTRVLADFRHGRIVDLDGWRVSETEARLCAAAA